MRARHTAQEHPISSPFVQRSATLVNQRYQQVVMSDHLDQYEIPSPLPTPTGAGDEIPVLSQQLYTQDPPLRFLFS